MFSNLGWTEMLVIAVIAIIFVGPKDLPTMLRTFGGFMRKARGMAGDFQKQVDDALREAELDDVRKSIEDVRSLDPKKALRDKLNPFTDAEDPVFDEEKLPGLEPPVEVDVDAALARQAEIDAAPKPNPSTGTNGVPGLAPVVERVVEPVEAAPDAKPSKAPKTQKALKTGKTAAQAAAPKTATPKSKTATAKTPAAKPKASKPKAAVRKPKTTA